MGVATCGLAVLRSCGLAVALAPAMSMSAGLSAQTLTPPNDRVIHLWVDPAYGSDAAPFGAPGLNPNGASACGANPSMPLDMLDPAQGNAPLLHAPWPFRTITAAIAYLYANTPNPPGTSPLPYLSGEYRAMAAIIHLMPGLYRTDTGIELHTRLAGNGETFRSTCRRS